ncbi:MAG: hypothetical protein IPK02_10665 [Candidatus Accumulibacter sp.]|jgi:hypothetical protein|uniref:Lipoprotein n=1 Tax=Candidatus Accumulibacter affinis TaxID=2954384 RepID=A0A935T7E5_9PROT|nr:hypothetical protein [Candidatus Accumulibacter affinis]
MQLKTTSLRTLILTLSLMLAACFPGPEKVGELARTSMQQRFRDDPQFQGSGLEVVDVRVIGGGDKQFDALARVLHAGKTHEVPVIIVVDGINLQWFAAPTAFAFAVPTQPTDPQPIPR